MKKTIRKYVLVCVLYSMALANQCPPVHTDCTCNSSNAKVEVTCQFQSTNISEPIVNSTDGVHIDVLDLTSNNLTAIPEFFLSGITSLGRLNLQNNALTNIPAIVNNLTNITVLDVSDNQIEILNFSLLDQVKIGSLNCAFNQIQEIVLSTFDLPSLTSLNVSHNQLHDVPSDIFKISKALDLSYNAIVTLRQLPKSDLAFLYLNNNILSTIDAHTFENSQKLYELYLNNNRISELSSESFNGLEILTELYLNGNDIKELLPRMFSPCKFLVKLSLTDNKLTTLSSEMFIGLEESLQQLELRNNRLGFQPNDTFANLNNLRHLDLSHNAALRDVNHITFPPHISSLEVQNSSLKEILNCKFLKFSDLQYLDLSNNNFSCSCHLSLLHSWFKDRTVHSFAPILTNRNQWTCRDVTTGLVGRVKDNAAYCGRYQDINAHCGDTEAYIQESSPIKINTTMVTSDNLITLSWSVQGSIENVFGFRISYESGGSILFKSPVLDNTQSSFVISFVDEKDQYSVCVDALSNETNTITTDCQSVSNLNLDYLIGILAGVLLLIPCLGALIYILHKDKIIQRAKYAPLEENPTKCHPDKHSVVVAVDDSTVCAVNVDKPVCHENKAFSTADECKENTISAEKAENIDKTKIDLCNVTDETANSNAASCPEDDASSHSASSSSESEHTKM